MLHYQTISEILKSYLHVLMHSAVFGSFRLVGGTALSLQLGHRTSVDIDLFSDAAYGSIDFDALDDFVESAFPFCDHLKLANQAFGKSYLIGEDRGNAIKLDVFYTDKFIQPSLIDDNIRMATIEEIIAMKMDVVQRGGRKKDFWDLHELLPRYNVADMLLLHLERYPHAHDENLILENMIDFKDADDDFDPVCLRGKYWEFIKEDLEDAVSAFRKAV